MVSGEVRTLLVLGADGDLARRLLLPGLAALLASDWAPQRELQVLGAGSPTSTTALGTAGWRRRSALRA